MNYPTIKRVNAAVSRVNSRHKPKREPLLKDACLQAVIKEHVLKILAQCNGNKTHASERLGISIRGLRDMLKRWEDE